MFAHHKHFQSDHNSDHNSDCFNSIFLEEGIVAAVKRVKMLDVVHPASHQGILEREVGMHRRW